MDKIDTGEKYEQSWKVEFLLPIPISPKLVPRFHHHHHHYHHHHHHHESEPIIIITMMMMIMMFMMIIPRPKLLSGLKRPTFSV